MGEPNKRLSRAGELRWGNQGARIVYPERGAFKDTEADCDGGTLALIQHVAGVDRAGAMAWLSERGMIAPSESGVSKPAVARQHAVRLSPGQCIVATFEYRDRGKLLYRKHRIEPGKGGRSKEFAFDRPSDTGGWQWGRGDRAVPYRADALAAADLIVIAEGEAKADKLAGWGYAATSLKDWHDSFAAHVRGKRVVILPDNDETGEQLANRTAIMVAAADGQAVKLELPRLPAKGDILDWDGDAAEFASLIHAVPFAAPATFDIADLAVWANTAPTPKAFVMAPFIPREDVVIVTGDGGTNKSTLALQISACAAAGKQMLGMDVSEGRALYITAEDDQRENHWRLAKIATAIGTSMHDLIGRLHVVSLRGRLNNELATFEGDGTLRTAPAYALLQNTIRATGAKLVTLDNVAHLFAGNENDRGQATAFINLLYQLCGDLGVTILLIAHRNKAGDTYSGSTAWLNAVRSQILLERTDEADPDARRMSLGKANYARQGEATGFRWHDFALVRDQDLSPETQAQVSAVITANADNEVFLGCLAERLKQRRAVSEKHSPTYAPTEFAKMSESKRIGKARLEAAMDRLFRLGRIERGELWKGDDRKAVFGLRETAGNGAVNTVQETRETVEEVAENRAGDAGRTHTPPKGGSGAALEAAAPPASGVEKRLDWSRFDKPSSRMILAPGETEEDAYR